MPHLPAGWGVGAGAGGGATTLGGCGAGAGVGSGVEQAASKAMGIMLVARIYVILITMEYGQNRCVRLVLICNVPIRQKTRQNN